MKLAAPPRGRRPARRRVERALRLVWALVVAVLTVLRTSSSRAEVVTTPVSLQAELLVKVAPYDRSFGARAGDRVRVALVTRNGDADSLRGAEQMKAALGDVDRIGGLPHEEMIMEYSGAGALLEACRSRRISIVYFAGGLGDQVDAVRAALDGADVLTVTGSADDVPRGVVLGFVVQDGKTKLLLNLTQARKQNVAFKSEIVRLMKVYE